MKLSTLLITMVIITAALIGLGAALKSPMIIAIGNLCLFTTLVILVIWIIRRLLSGYRNRDGLIH